MPSEVIAIAGKMASGKTSLARELCKRLNAEFISFGAYVRSEAVKRGMTLDVSSLQSLGEHLIQTLGTDAFVNAVLHSRKSDQGAIVLDGVRSVEVWYAVQRFAYKSVLVYIEIDDATRRVRLLQAGKIPHEQLDNVMTHPLEVGVPNLKQYADVVLGNNKSVSEMAALVLSATKTS